MEGNLTYNFAAGTPAGTTEVINLCKDLSGLTAKGHSSTKRDGTMLTYIVDVELMATTTSAVGIFTAPETWKLKNAFKKWHELRHFMFKESGLSRKEIGRYAHEIRPYFGPAHEAFKRPSSALIWDAGNEDWDTDLPPTTGGDWTTTTIAIETDESGPVDVDTFDLHLVGPHLGAEQAWTSVGMIMGYNADRSQSSRDPLNPVSYRDNPLAFLKGRSESVKEVLDIMTAEVADGPPYDIAIAGDSVNPVLAGTAMSSSTGAGRVTVYGVRVPAGLLALSLSAAAIINVRVKRIEESRV